MNQQPLPEPSHAELAHAQKLGMIILEMMKRSGGAIPFSHFFNLALYHDNLGYYTGSLPVFGREGDFVTAPIISPYFSFALANQCIEIFAGLDASSNLDSSSSDSSISERSILEIGAGNGVMAMDMLTHFRAKDQLPAHYYILERSKALRAIQYERLAKAFPDYIEQIIWLDEPPKESWQGVIVANEVIDALAVERFTIYEGAPHYIDVGLKQDDESKTVEFISQLRPADEALLNFIKFLAEYDIHFPEGYQSEYCPFLEEWMPTLFETMERGAAIFIDYGYEEREYYRPERDTGTLLAHFKHHAHEEFYRYPGIQDLTSNVNFTQVADIAINHIGLDLLGYTTQNFFLFGAGLESLIAEAHAKIEDDVEWFKLSKGVQELVSPESMGERFKVIAFGKNYNEELSGFSIASYEDRL